MNIDDAIAVSEAPPSEAGRLETIATQFIQLVLSNINREYPHSGKVWLNSEADIKSPREVHPAFYGCLDWHSAVHGHWLLVRLARCFPEASFQTSVRTALDGSLTPVNLQQEATYLKQHPLFECPYGWAWLLQLATELREWSDPQATVWLSALEPLEATVASHFQHWLQNLEQPNRTGVHANTAFALGLAFDWTRTSGHQALADLIHDQSRRFYRQDRDYPFWLEPLGYDFISPSLSEADLMRRLLRPAAFANWLTDFLPSSALEQREWQLVSAKNPENYQQAHFRGLHLSRAWMLEGLCSGLPSDDPRIEYLNAKAAQYWQFTRADITDEHYASSHWVGTFAVYLLTKRGLHH
ncbi:hypothetical protein C1752_01745 [Acaryochloris thomasi RCC1774]|uniref:DUF2891 domain-containing protein n=1 Tax=Acaryochloris thomasi RCC1774 TaxID=1764569 RepID=A0A2W1JZA8_9CYAN|nr:DUF2891 domain-containing protein [Acaryochloris thomasi]PZD73801.1 hypothetical protein C1752_01745 [Acaryochloris thomasi RCC1774]